MKKPILNKHLFIILLLVFMLTFTSIVAGKIMAWVYVVDEESPQINNAQIGGGYFGGGNGTETNPYLIMTPKHFSNLSLLQFYGKITSKAYFKLENDIEFSNSGWLPPIGTSENKFIGDFNGNGKVLRNLKITTDSSKLNYTVNEATSRTFDGIGVFGNVDSGANIYSFNISQAVIETSTLSSDQSYIGYICGVLNGSASNIGVYNSKMQSDKKIIQSDYGLIGQTTSGIKKYNINSGAITGGEQGGNSAGGKLIIDLAEITANTATNEWLNPNAPNNSANSYLLPKGTWYNAPGSTGNALYMVGEFRIYKDKEYTFSIEGSGTSRDLYITRSSTKTSWTKVTENAVEAGKKWWQDENILRITTTLFTDNGNSGDLSKIADSSYPSSNYVIRNSQYYSMRFNSAVTSTTFGNDDAKGIVHINPIMDGKIRLILMNDGSKATSKCTLLCNDGTKVEGTTTKTENVKYVEFDVEKNKKYQFFSSLEQIYFNYLEFDGTSETGASGGGSTSSSEVEFIDSVDFISEESTLVGGANYNHSYQTIKVEANTPSSKLVVLNVKRTNDILSYNTDTTIASYVKPRYQTKTTKDDTLDLTLIT